MIDAKADIKTAAHLPTQVVSAEHEENLSLAEVAERAQQLEADRARHSQALFDGSNGEFADAGQDTHPVSVIAEEVLAEFSEPDEHMSDVYLAVRLRLQEKLPPEVFGAIAPHIDGSITVETELSKLNEKYGGEMRAHRDATFQRVVTDIDWDQMVETFLSDQWPEGASLDKQTAYDRMRIITFTSRRTEISSMYTEAGGLQELIDLAGSIGAMRSEPLPESSAGWYIHGDLTSALWGWDEATRTAISYMTGPRLGLVRQAMYDTEGERMAIEDFARRTHMTGINDVQVPAVMVEACERQLARVIQKFEARDREILQAENQRRPNMLHIGMANQELLKLNTGIDDIPAWLHERLERFGHYGHGIGFIEFTDGDESHLAANDDDPRATIEAGARILGENKIHIDVRSGTLTSLTTGEYIFEGGLSKAYVKKAINKTFDHEVGHHMHCAMLTTEQLSMWQEALEAEPDLDIDPYIRNLADGGAPDFRLRREQFSVTIEKFMNDPVVTADRYPRRFAVLNSIIKRYDQKTLDEVLAPVRALRAQGNDSEARGRMIALELAYIRQYPDL